MWVADVSSNQDNIISYRHTLVMGWRVRAEGWAAESGRYEPGVQYTG